MQNTLTLCEKTKHQEIRKYIESVYAAAEKWYLINNPAHAFENGKIVAEEKRLLIKINRLGLRNFGPLTLSVYLTCDDIQKRIKYLESIERYIFLVYLCAGRRASLGNSEFSNMATDIYNNNCDLEYVLKRIDLLTYGDDEGWYDFSPDRFLSNIRDQFVGSKKQGYYDWAGIRYLLFEYDEYIRGNEESRVHWRTPNSIEHIYPQSNDADPSWRNAFRGFTAKQKRYLCNSLGNLVLLDRKKNSSLANNSFDLKKKKVYSTGNYSGYIVGSHSEIEVAQSKHWNAREIYKRGAKMLNFFSEKWNVELTRKEIKELLLIDSNLMQKIR